jgi:hypothetical protein
VGISREELIAFLDERAALTYVAMLRLAMHLWAGSRIFTGYLDQLRPSALGGVSIPLRDADGSDLTGEAWMPDVKSPTVTASTGWEARAKRIGQALACGDMKRHKGAISLSFDEPRDRDLVWSIFAEMRKESKNWWRD